MTARIKYTDEPIGNPKVIADFLPAPEDLALRDEGVKVTLALSKRSVDFFKNEARKHNTQYQRMIRRLLDAYAEHHAQTPASRLTGRKPAPLRPRGERRAP
jgi:predicted DNA binding CopG/RHH family protein